MTTAADMVGISDFQSHPFLGVNPKSYFGFPFKEVDEDAVYDEDEGVLTKSQI